MRWRGSCRIAVVLAGLTVFMLTSLITAGGALADSLSQSEITLLKHILPHINYIGAGVGGKPTIQFSGVNVQVVNGEGKTATTNGEGNLVIGYDENPRAQTGSHNLILGEEQEFTAYAGIDAGLLSSRSLPPTFLPSSMTSSVPSSIA